MIYDIVTEIFTMWKFPFLKSLDKGIPSYNAKNSLSKKTIPPFNYFI